MNTNMAQKDKNKTDQKVDEDIDVQAGNEIICRMYTAKTTKK